MVRFKSQKYWQTTSYESCDGRFLIMRGGNDSKQEYVWWLHDLETKDKDQVPYKTLALAFKEVKRRRSK